MKSTIFSILLLLGYAAASGAANPGDLLYDSLPSGWEYTEMAHQILPAEDTWWTRFDDPVLDSLINLAESRNYNLAVTAKRMQSARQAVREARSSWYPDLGLSAGWSRSRNSGAMSSPVGDAYTSGGFDLGVSMNWEIDIFGRTLSSVKAAQSSADASKAEYTAGMVSLCAQVAKTYIELRMYQEQLAVANAHRESQQKVVDIAKARHEAGIGDMLDVSQALTVLYSTRASVPALEAMIESSINALATLTAQRPAEIHRMLTGTSARMPRDPGYIAAGVPADLLRRRPDIVQAEAEVAQMAALCGVAKKDFLPTLSLGAGVSTSARNGKDLFSGRSFGWSVAPALNWTIFDGLARNARSAEARLNLESAIDNYNEVVLNSVEEVNNALANYNAGLRAIQLRKDVINESRRSFDLALDLYKQGLTPFSNVSDAMISLLTNQNSLISSEGKLLNSYISLYQALGGGF